MVAVDDPSDAVVSAGDVANTRSPVPVAPVLVTPSMVWWPVNVLEASVRATVADVVGKVIVVESVPAKVSVLENVTILLPVTVRVPVVADIVRPFTLVGVIAPATIVIAGVVVAFATLPEKPFAVATDTVVTVPDPDTAAQLEVVPLVVRNCPDFPAWLGRMVSIPTFAKVLGPVFCITVDGAPAASALSASAVSTSELDSCSP